jgi:hypothetical protein
MVMAMAMAMVKLWFRWVYIRFVGKKKQNSTKHQLFFAHEDRVRPLREIR